MLTSTDLATTGGISTGAYTLSVNATSVFGQSATKTVSFAVAASGQAPVISIVGPAERLYYRGDGFKITSDLVPESVCDGAQVRRR